MPDVNSVELYTEGQLYYSYNPVHRDMTNGKSQWTISTDEELTSFITTYNRQWIIGNSVGWGFHFQRGQAQYLGVAKDHITPVFLAKFRNDIPHNTWHGYPVHYERNPQDIPHETILAVWLVQEPIPPSKIRKIMKGQPCKLSN